MPSPRLLVVEDQRSAREYLRLLLEQEGFESEVAEDGVQALVALERGTFDLVLSDLHMPNLDGLELLSHVKQRWPELPVIVVTANSEVSDVVEAVRRGATNYLVKPAAPPAVIAAVKKALLARPTPSEGARTIPELVGRSRAIVEVRRQVTLAAQSDVPVLVTGRTGTGKELVARAIHRYSKQGSGPFVAHNCAVSPHDLFESTFFGHRRGSFTGADRDHAGLLVQADEGVLFLDELETLPLPHQAKLLRVLDDGEVRAVGAAAPVQVAVRFVAATNLDPREMIDEGSLREDLYYRLRGFEIALPPLEERRDDIPELARHFLGEDDPGFTPEALAALVHASWPGNVRQLRHAVRSARAAAGAGSIDLPHLPLDRESRRPAAGDDGGVPRGATLKEIEHRAILQALADCNGNRTQAAKLLDIDRSTLRRKLREYGITEDS